jgi:hypothetical protein
MFFRVSVLAAKQRNCASEPAVRLGFATLFEIGLVGKMAV